MRLGGQVCDMGWHRLLEVHKWHISEMPPAANEARSWLKSVLPQATTPRVYEFTP
jgi:hypothetical protein